MLSKTGFKEFLEEVKRLLSKTVLDDFLIFLQEFRRRQSLLTVKVGQSFNFDDSFQFGS